jgi:hypothetical protein
MQTPRNWLSLKTEALKFPRIFTLAHRGLKPISNDSSQTIKYILSISVLILKRYILDPEEQQQKHENWIPRETTRTRTQQHRVEERPKGYPEPSSKSSEHNEKCPLSARAGFLAKPYDTLIQHRKVSRDISEYRRATLSEFVRYFFLRRATLQQCRTTFLQDACDTGKCRATFPKKACDTHPVSYDTSPERRAILYSIVRYPFYGRAIHF